MQLHQTELEAFESMLNIESTFGIKVKRLIPIRLSKKIKQQDEEIRQLHLQVKGSSQEAGCGMQSAHEVVKELNDRKTDTAIEPHRS